MMIPNSVKTAALAALLGLGAVVAGSAPAAAYTYKTECFGDTCQRVRCDDFGNYCEQVGYRDYDRYRDGYRHETRYVCDEDGYNCRYEHVSGYYDAYGDWHPYEY